MLLYKSVMVSPSGASMPFFQATLPLPPSVNDAHIPVTKYINGRPRASMAPSAELVTFKRDAARLLPSQSWLEQEIYQVIKNQRQKTALSIHCNFYLVKRWVGGDTDNRIKYAQDVCFKFLGLNDNLVDFVSAQRFLDAGNPRCEIEISCFTA